MKQSINWGIVKTFTICILVLAGLYLSFEVRSVFVLLFFAFIINAGLRPVISYLEKKGINRGLGIFLVYFILVAAILFFAFVTLNEALNQVRSFGTSIVENPERVSTLIKQNFPYIENVIDIDSTVNQFKDLANGGKDFKNFTSSDAFGNIMQATNIIGSRGLNIVEGVVGGIISIMLILVVSAYMLYPKENFHDSLLSLFPSDSTRRLSKTLMKIQTSLGAWMGGQLILMSIIGFASYVVIMLPRVFDPNYDLYKFAIILGILAGILEALPNFGPILTAVIAVIAAVLTGTSLPIIIFIVLMFALLQQVEALLIVPAIMKKAIDLHPILSIVGIIIGFELGGPITALLSIPVIGAIQIIIFELSDEWKAKNN